MLAKAGSIGGCAERNALWKLAPEHMTNPKSLVVSRIRKDRNYKNMTFGDSKPCQSCIIAMQMYNVERVCFSINKTDFLWTRVSDLTTDLTTKSKTIIRFPL
jgi:hypothetical protein